MTPEFEPEVVIWSKLLTRTEKSPKQTTSNVEQLNFPRHKRKSMTPNPFLVTSLRPEVELMHLMRMRRHHCHFSNTRYWTDSASSLERYHVW